VFEVRQRITEEPLTRCEACGGRVKRLLSPAPFILKGEGWYVTDYPSEARKKALQSEKGGGDTTSEKPAASAEKSSTSATDSSGTTGSTASAASTSAAPSSG
jgi:putative FmdB family regulatory protein